MLALVHPDTHGDHRSIAAHTVLREMARRYVGLNTSLRAVLAIPNLALIAVSIVWCFYMRNHPRIL